jgi:putative acetyltransferase
MTPRVRVLTAGDAAAIFPIYRDSSTARMPDEITEALTVEMVAQALSHDGIGLVAVEGEVVVGFVLGPRHPVRRLSHVMTNVLVCVEASARGRGIGRALMSELALRARASDWCERIEFHVRASNVRAIALYESLGFVVEGRLRARVANGDERGDDLIMALLLRR